MNRIRIAAASVMVAAGLIGALAAPATSAAKDSVSVSVTADPSCNLRITGTWTSVPRQSFLGIGISDNQTGLSAPQTVSIGLSETQETVTVTGGPLTPLQTGRHVLKVTLSVLDGSGNPLISGKANTSLPCAITHI